MWHKEIVYVSLIDLMSWCEWSFWNTPPPSKGSRRFPGDSQGNCTPSSETLLSPTAQGIMLSTSSRELPADGGDTPSLRLGVYLCFPSGWFLLTHYKWRSLLCPVHQTPLHTLYGRSPWITLSPWSSLSVKAMYTIHSPESEQQNSPWEILVLGFWFHPASSLKSFPSLVQIRSPYLSWLSKVGLMKQRKNEVRGKDTIETLLR